MYTEPKLEQRAEQPYVGIRLQVPMSEFGRVISQTHNQIFGWLSAQGIQPAGAPFMQYHIINMSDNMDVELGVPIAESVTGSGQLKAGALPAGQYATTVYTGIDDGMEATKALLEWAEKQGIVWDTYDSDMGDGFGARIEFYITDPAEEPDMTKWETEIAIRLADEKTR